MTITNNTTTITRSSTRADYVARLRQLADRSMTDRTAAAEASALTLRAVQGGLISPEADERLSQLVIGKENLASKAAFRDFLHEYADTLATAGDVHDTWTPQVLDRNAEQQRAAVDALRGLAASVRQEGLNGSYIQSARTVVFAALDMKLVTENELLPLFVAANDANAKNPNDEASETATFVKLHNTVAELIAAKTYPVDSYRTSWDAFDAAETASRGTTASRPSSFEQEALAIIDKGDVNPTTARRLAVATLNHLADRVEQGSFPVQEAVSALDSLAHAAVDAGMLDHDLYHVITARAVAEGEPTDFNVAKVIREIAVLLQTAGESEDVGGEEPASITPSAEAMAQQLRVLGEEMQSLIANGDPSALPTRDELLRTAVNATTSAGVMNAAVKAGYITDERYRALREQNRPSNGGSPMSTLNAVADEIEKSASANTTTDKVA